MNDLCDSPKPSTLLSRAILIPSGIALLIVMLFLTLGHIRFSQIGSEFVIAIVYSSLISIPSIFLLTRVSFQFTDRFPRLVILLQIAILATMAVLGSLVGGLIVQFLGVIPRNLYWAEFRTTVQFCIFISLLVGLSISIFETMKYRLQAAQLALRTQQVEQERAYKLLAEARLSSLESRIHPHFLFNTLNSIASLIPSDPKHAEEIVERLASLLRFSLNAHQHGLVPLSKELTIVRDYLEIEKTRFGSRLRYEIAVPESLQSASLPPLALQTLVENSIKHVVTQRQQGGSIQVTAALESGLIHLDVTDDGPGFSLETIPPGHGLENLIARLKILFGDQAALTVSRKQAQTTVRLTIPASHLAGANE